MRFGLALGISIPTMDQIQKKIELGVGGVGGWNSLKEEASALPRGQDGESACINFERDE